MANTQKTSTREKEVTNGIAHDGLAHSVDSAVQTAASKVGGWRPELQGYFLMASGAALLLFAFGFFPAIKWAIVAASILLVGWGVVRSNIIAKTAHLIDRYRSR